MKTAEIRARVHAAVGDGRYPAALADRVAHRISEPVRPMQPRVYGLVAALLALLIIGVLVFTRLATGVPLGFRPVPGFQSNQVPGPVNPDAQVPEIDLANTQLN